MCRTKISDGLWLALFLLLSVSIISKANAEYVFNLPWKDIRDQSRDASIQISDGLSNLFKSFEMLEKGKIDDANEYLKKSRYSLKNAEKIYSSIEATIRPGTIDIKGLAPYYQGILERDFRNYRLRVPVSRKEAAKLSLLEIRSYAELLREIEKYTKERQRTRRLLKILVEDLHRFMRIGIYVSELAASNP